MIGEADRQRIARGIRAKYVRVAESPTGGFRYPTGREGLERLGYDPDLLARLPEAVVKSYCGVGRPWSLGPVDPGDRILDIGCGGGVDLFVAALMTGPNGSAVGLEMVPEMLDLARANLALTGLENVVLEAGSAEDLPFPDGTFDLVVSNGVFNLIPDKKKALDEVFRVLKPGGRLMMADQVLKPGVALKTTDRVASWFQ